MGFQCAVCALWLKCMVKAEKESMRKNKKNSCTVDGVVVSAGFLDEPCVELGAGVES